jgi:hypothetical protein
LDSLVLLLVKMLFLLLIAMLHLCLMLAALLLPVFNRLLMQWTVLPERLLLSQSWLTDTILLPKVGRLWMRL